MKQSKSRIGMRIAWVGWFLFTIWVIAKMTGMINTPSWLTYFPYFTSSLVVAGLLVSFGRYLEKFDVLIERMINLEKTVSKNTSEIISMKAKLV